MVQEKHEHKNTIPTKYKFNSEEQKFKNKLITRKYLPGQIQNKMSNYDQRSKDTNNKENCRKRKNAQKGSFITSTK